MGFVGVRRSVQKLRRYAFLGRRFVLIRHKSRSNPQGGGRGVAAEDPSTKVFRILGKADIDDVKKLIG